METRTGVRTSEQVSKFGGITGLDEGDFVLSDGAAFLVKNDNDEAVTLEVLPVKGTAWVETKFAPGWNPELVWQIKQNATATNLLWGY
jgi:hypothetical protein